MSSEGRRSIIARQTGSNLRTGNFVTVVGGTNGSGGTALAASGTYTPLDVYIKNASITSGTFFFGGSGAIYVGSSGNPPYASGGYVLFATEKECFNVDRPDFIRVYGQVSGIQCTWYGVDF